MPTENQSPKRASPDLEPRERKESELGRHWLLGLLVLAAAVAALSRGTLRAILQHLEAVQLGVAVLIVLFAVYLWKKTAAPDRKSTRLNSSHVRISYAVFCLKKKNVRA